MHAYGTPADVPDRQGPLSEPVQRSSAWAAPDAETTRARGAGESSDSFYVRYGHPNGRSFEGGVARLEGADGAVSFASGMAAMHGAVFGLCGAGDRVLIADRLYGGTDALALHEMPRFGLEVHRFDPQDLDALDAGLAHAGLVVVETPINPMLRLVDLEAVAARCRAAGVPCLVDSTFAPPPVQRPIQLGFDLVMHSATKFLGGHSDLCAGVLAGSHGLLERIERFRRRTGGILAPDVAWLLSRSLHTHELRVRAQQDAARRIAEDLERRIGELPLIGVHYPGLQSHPDADLAARQMDGGGALLTLDVVGEEAGARAVFDALELVARAPSLGGIETIASLPPYSTHAHLSRDERLAMGIPPGALRLSIGLESPAEILGDLTAALESARRTVDAI